MHDPTTTEAGIERAETIARRLYADAAGYEHRAQQLAAHATELARAARLDAFTHPTAAGKAERKRDEADELRARAHRLRTAADRELELAYGSAPWRADDGPRYAAELYEPRAACGPRFEPMYTRAGRNAVFASAYERRELWRTAEMHAAAGIRRVLARPMPNA